MSTKWKWILGTIGTIVVGALGSGLWNLVFAPLGGILARAALSTVTLGISSARDHVYASAASGYSERASLALLCLVGLLFFMIPFSSLIIYVFVSRYKHALSPVTREDRIRRGGWTRRMLSVLLPLNTLVGSVILVQTLLYAYTCHVISRFNRTLAVATPHISQQERSVFLARFAKIQTRNDFLVLFADLNSTLVAHGDKKSDFSPW